MTAHCRPSPFNVCRAVQPPPLTSTAASVALIKRAEVDAWPTDDVQCRPNMNTCCPVAAQVALCPIHTARPDASTRQHCFVASGPAVWSRHYAEHRYSLYTMLCCVQRLDDRFQSKVIHTFAVAHFAQIAEYLFLSMTRHNTLAHFPARSS